MDCIRHRVIMLSSESFWPTKHEYGDATRQVYTFACLVCGYGHTLECDDSTGRSVTKPYQYTPKPTKARTIAHHAPKIVQATAVIEVSQNPASQLSMF